MSNANQVALDMPDDEVSKRNLNAENTAIIKNVNQGLNVVETTPLMPGHFFTAVEPMESEKTLGTVEINQTDEQRRNLALQESHTDDVPSPPSDLGAGLVERKNTSRKTSTEESQPLQNSEPLESQNLSEQNNSDNEGTGSTAISELRQNGTTVTSFTCSTIAQQPDVIPLNSDNSESIEKLVAVNKEEVSETKVEEPIRAKTETVSQITVKKDTDSAEHPDVMSENCLGSECIEKRAETGVEKESKSGDYLAPR